MSPAVERLAGRHAEPEELVAYRAHRLGEEEVERLQDHLALCSECTELLLDLASFEAIEPRLGVTPVAPDREIVEGYAALMAVVEPEVGAARRGTGPDVGFTSAGNLLAAMYSPLPWTRTILPWVVAGSMALVSIGLSVRLAQKPSGDRNFNSMILGEEMTRGNASPNSTLLEIPAPSLKAYDSYRVEILDSADQPLKVFDGLRPNNQGRLSVLLSPRELGSEDAKHQVRVSGLSGSILTVLGTKRMFP